MSWLSGGDCILSIIDVAQVSCSSIFMDQRQFPSRHPLSKCKAWCITITIGLITSNFREMAVYPFETEDVSSWLASRTDVETDAVHGQSCRIWTDIVNSSYISNSIPWFYRLDSIAHIQVCGTSPSFKTLACTSTSALALCKSDEDVNSPNIGKAEVENGTMKRLSFQSSTPKKTIFDGALNVLSYDFCLFVNGYIVNSHPRSPESVSAWQILFAKFFSQSILVYKVCDSFTFYRLAPCVVILIIGRIGKPKTNERQIIFGLSFVRSFFAVCSSFDYLPLLFLAWFKACSAFLGVCVNVGAT